jgi:hypothetical protein
MRVLIPFMQIQSEGAECYYRRVEVRSMKEFPSGIKLAADLGERLTPARDRRRLAKGRRQEASGSTAQPSAPPGVSQGNAVLP